MARVGHNPSHVEYGCTSSSSAGLTEIICIVDLHVSTSSAFTKELIDARCQYYEIEFINDAGTGHLLRLMRQSSYLAPSKEARTRPLALRASNSGAYFLSRRCEVRTGRKIAATKYFVFSKNGTIKLPAFLEPLSCRECV